MPHLVRGLWVRRPSAVPSAGFATGIVADTLGNPLALLELPRLDRDGAGGGVRAVGSAGADGPDRRELSPPARRPFRRLDDLSADARLLLLIAAAEPVGDWADLAENGEGTVAQAFVFTFA